MKWTSLVPRLLEAAAIWLDRRRPWHERPTPIGILMLIGLRHHMRRRNLYDTTRQPAVNLPKLEPPDAIDTASRTADGSYNDLACPAMGMAGSRFGRNVPVDRTFPDLEAILEPNPREVSRVLLTRPDGQIQAADSANALAAAWVQFMIRDWFSHGRSTTGKPWDIPLRGDDPWPHPPMQIMPTPPDPTRPKDPTDLPPTFVNENTHWWDASQIYGSDRDYRKLIRAETDGKLLIQPDGLLPYPKDRARDPTKVPGFWLGLAMMQILFVREHNAICNRLLAEYPNWSSDQVFERARLINAALLAKIHTVEWTPAVLDHPTIRLALPANWWGLVGRRLHRLARRFTANEAISGIPGSRTRHDGVPYAMTEEFVAVYRMHPLLPDRYDFRAAEDNHDIDKMTLGAIAGPNAIGVLHRIPMPDLLYSFGTINSGLVTLHNYPEFLQTFERPDGNGYMDLAATDILRCRELGVPRYNEFRRLVHLPPAKDFESLTDNPVWVKELREVYRDNIERVDLMVGMLAEPRPRGFAFSDTAFRIFAVMASRRLNSDRFFTNDYNPDVYTSVGLDWIERTTMRDVLLRHYPDLGGALAGVKNAFKPWGPPHDRDRGA
jgi:hypothetical protein